MYYSRLVIFHLTSRASVHRNGYPKTAGQEALVRLVFSGIFNFKSNYHRNHSRFIITNLSENIFLLPSLSFFFFFLKQHVSELTEVSLHIYGSSRARITHCAGFVLKFYQHRDSTISVRDKIWKRMQTSSVWISELEKECYGRYVVEAVENVTGNRNLCLCQWE